MLQRPLTKKDLLDLAIDIYHSTALPYPTLHFLFMRAPAPVQHIPTVFLEKDLVEPETFLERLKKAAGNFDSNSPSSTRGLAKNLLKTIFYDDLEMMPLYINDISLGLIARWRLKNGI